MEAGGGSARILLELKYLPRLFESLGTHMNVKYPGPDFRVLHEARLINATH